MRSIPGTWSADQAYRMHFYIQIGRRVIIHTQY
jgi:hypothetical protein